MLGNTLGLSVKVSLIPSQMPLCLPKCQAEDFQVGGEMNARQGSAGCVCCAPKSLCWRLMSFPVSGLLAERPAEAQMTSLETSLSLGEITNGAQPWVPAASGSLNSFLGLTLEGVWKGDTLDPSKCFCLLLYGNKTLGHPNFSQSSQ